MSYIHPMGGWGALSSLGTKLAAAVSKPAAPAATPPAGSSPAPKPPTSAPPAASSGSWVSGPVLLIAGGTAIAAYLLLIRGRQ